MKRLILSIICILLCESTFANEITSFNDLVKNKYKKTPIFSKVRGYCTYSDTLSFTQGETILVLKKSSNKNDTDIETLINSLYKKAGRWNVRTYTSKESILVRVKSK